MEENSISEETSDLLIRKVPREVLDRLSVKARAANQDRMDWVRDLLMQVADMPVTRERFAYRVQGVSGRGLIRRMGNDLRATSSTYQNFSEAEAEAMRQAENYIRRNQPGDLVKALGILDAAFQEVFEVPV